MELREITKTGKRLARTDKQAALDFFIQMEEEEESNEIKTQINKEITFIFQSLGLATEELKIWEKLLEKPSLDSQTEEQGLIRILHCLKALERFRVKFFL